MFKTQFRTSAYTCRLQSCPRATIEFNTNELRRENEVAHTGGFRCTFLGCQYPPFRTSEALAAHGASNHCQFTSLTRQSIRRVGRLQLDDKYTSIKENRKNDDDESTKTLDTCKNPSSTEQQLAPSVIDFAANISKKCSRSPPSSPRKSPKGKRSGPACDATKRCLHAQYLNVGRELAPIRTHVNSAFLKA